ncbi:MAG: carboxypeptidase regulatory-like domain-containing protein [Bacteroidetes bacterium]|nr:carboxypeptidase regulatory-like domain-containing protein [Bacteroidota bacterium]
MSEPALLPRFTAFKGKYTASWVTARLSEVDQAESTPGNEQRKARHKALRIQLLTTVRSALQHFSALERYIVHVTPPQLLKSAIEAAGGTDYAAASNSNFDACRQMLHAAAAYATDNATILMAAGQNMPATFPAQLTALLISLDAAHAVFLGSETEAQQQAAEKLILNNALYTTIVQAVNADAQIIFSSKEEEAIRHQFVFRHQRYLVRGAGVAGMRFHITDAVTGAPVPDVLISIPAKSTTLTTNAEGRALRLRLSSGEYLINCEKSGYHTLRQTILLEAGTVQRVYIRLTSMEPAPS